MRKLLINTFLHSLGLILIFLTGCSAELNNEPLASRKGGPAEVYASLSGTAQVDSRTVKNSYDNWTNSVFSTNDKVGMYALKGAQDPDDETSFNQSVVNQPMFYDGRVGDKYKFSNPDITLDAETTHAGYSYMYWPYYEDMPSTTDSSSLPGIPLREEDDGIEKCIDFMSTLWMFNYTNYRYIPLTNGMLQPEFFHHGSILGIQRGHGFDDPKDPTIWVVCKNPYTDVRVYQDNYKPTEFFRFEYQYHPPEGEDVKVSLNPDKPDQKVDKYRAWQCWKGNDYKEVETYYAVLPTNQNGQNSVSYILLQDNNGTWQTVTDFYLESTGNKTLKYNQRYLVSISLKGLTPVVKPVLIEDWNEQKKVTDDRKVGIHTPEEFAEWVALYNTYIDEYRPNEYEEQLSKYGDAVKSGDGTNVRWTFYINSDITLENGESYVINQLEDVLEGSSVYTNYSISNLRHTLINEMETGGEIRALDFDGMYVIATGSTYYDNFCGGLIGKMSGGGVKNININKGILVTDKMAGMIAGSISRGEVSGCRISGDVIGIGTSSDYPGLFGDFSTSGSPVVENNDTVDLSFINY